jgi:hypothetical protein
VNFCQDPDLCRKVQSAQIFPDAVIRPISDSLNSLIAHHLESNNKPLESGESYLTGWYLEVQEFQICLIFKILFRPNCRMVQFSFQQFG